VENPFDDIVPRITAAEKRAQQRAREEAQKEREEAERRKGAKKYVYSFPPSRLVSEASSEFIRYCRNVKLLSFADDEDAAEEAEPVTFKKKGIVRPDCVYQLNFVAS
jgi:peptidyl-prolyl cis-trans isomerase SDCCAG10